jgi:hypothetical protein
MKVPPHEFNQTINFYKNILGLKQTGKDGKSIAFDFGEKTLWIDKVPGISQAEIWLEIITNDLKAAENYFKSKKIVRCDDIEPLPKGFRGFWISAPNNIIHLVTSQN